jgi:SAM-dependent methyltransferase
MAEMRARAVSSEYQQFLMPLNRRLLNRSLGVVLHNRYAASQLEGLDRDLPVEIIPHHLSPAVQELDRMDKVECRRSLGIPADAWVIASFGFVTESKRIPAVLAAFKRLLEIAPNALYLVVGEDHWKWSVGPVIEEMGLHSRARVTGYTTERDFFRYLKAVDLIVNLRYPTAGETSGTLIRALGSGKPVIVSDFGQFGELPDDVCLKVPPGPDEEKLLYTKLRALTLRPTLRERMSHRAVDWVRSECEISRSAARYLDFAQRIIERQKGSKGHTLSGRTDYRLKFKDAPAIEFDREEALDYVVGFFTDDPEASGYIRLHRDRLTRTVELVPAGDGNQRLLELSSYLQMPLLIKRYGNYGEVAVTNWWEGEPREKIIPVRHSVTGEEFSFPMKNVDVERNRFPFPDDYFDVALCCELIEHLREDPMNMLVELNRVLKWGGLVILTTPNITSAFSVQEAMAGRSPNIYSLYNRKSPADRHSREYTPSDVRAALESAGFKVINLFTENVWHKTDEEFLKSLDRTGVPRHLRGDNIYAVGRKQSAQLNRYPQELYD